MREKAIFFATMGMVGWGDSSAVPSSSSISSGEWKALRLLTLAGYTIVIFTPDRSAVCAECREVPGTGDGVSRPTRALAGHQEGLTKQVTPLLQATATLQLDLDRSWLVADRLDSIEVGRVVGCRTVLLTDGSETEWEMTAMRWPDLIAGDMWEIACLIVMSDGSSVEGLSADLNEDDE